MARIEASGARTSPRRARRRSCSIGEFDDCRRPGVADYPPNRAESTLAPPSHGGRMRVLLLSMPDSFEHMAPIAIRMPNGALASLAGNIDPHHRVAIADLILAQGRIA